MLSTWNLSVGKKSSQSWVWIIETEKAGKRGFKKGKLRPAKMCQHTSTPDSVGYRLPAGSNCCQSGRPTKSEPPEGKILLFGNSSKIWGTFCITDILPATASAPPSINNLWQFLVKPMRSADISFVLLMYHSEFESQAEKSMCTKTDHHCNSRLLYEINFPAKHCCQ